MSQWGSAKARRVLAALLKIGWSIKRQKDGSHRILARPEWPNYLFAFHDNEEIGPKMLIAHILSAYYFLQQQYSPRQAFSLGAR